jgi:membrane fusion protein, multidrug efflux system
MKPTVLTPIAAAAIVAALAGCHSPEKHPAGNGWPAEVSATAPVREVSVTRPTPDALSVEISASGSLLPLEEAVISAEGAGVVVAVHIEEGTRVRRGDVLVQVDRVKAELAVRQSEAALAQAQANASKASADLARKQQLLDDKTIAPVAFEVFKAQHEAYSAGLDAAKTAVELARRRLEDLTVAAPFDGVVKEKRITVGEYVREGQNLLVLMRMDPLKLQFELPEKYAGRVPAGQPVRATVSALPGQVFSASVRTVFPALSIDTRTVRIEAYVPNRDYSLKPGFFASVLVPIAARPDSLVLPRAALVRRDGTEYVFVLKGDKAELIPVQVGVETGDTVEIVTGLNGDETVIVSGADTLRSGDRVKVRE